jgi:histidinol-phosphate aminotransferase
MTKLDEVLSRVRPEVREQRPYKVGVPTGDISVKLNQNESPFDLPEALKDAVFAGWKEIAFNRYPSEQPYDLAELIASSIGWDPEGIIVGNGSNELTYAVGLTFIKTGSSVVLPRPMFSFYERVVHIYGGEVIPVAPLESLGFDTEGILTAIQRTEPSVVVITSPNNPTGLVLSLAELRTIAEATAGLVLIDEAYIEFSDEPSMLTLLSNYPNVILLRTFSKAFGLAGSRLGYLVGHPAVMGEIMKIRPPFMIDRFTSCVIRLLLEHSQLVQDRVRLIRSSTKGLIEALKEVEGVCVLAGQANFVTFQPPCDGQKVFSALAERGVLVRNMSGYPELRGFLRVSAGTPAENRRFLKALTQAML